MKACQTCAAFTKEGLNEDDGLGKLTTKLKEDLFTEDQAMFNAYEKFETFHRQNEMRLNQHI